MERDHLISMMDLTANSLLMAQVAHEDFELCEKAQFNLTQGVYHEGILNPEKENGVSCELILPTVSDRN